MNRYIDAEKLKAEIERELSAHDKVDHLDAFEVGKAWNRGHRKALENILSIVDSLQQEQQDILVLNKKDWEKQEQFRKDKKFGIPLQQDQDRMRYCIEYINPQYPLLDSGELNIRHLRVPDEHGAEMALTLMLSLGAKIYALYRGNVIDGKLGEWSTPMIVDADDWYSASWLHDILDCGCSL